jgi:hypothetical protein
MIAWNGVHRPKRIGSWMFSTLTSEVMQVKQIEWRSFIKDGSMHEAFIRSTVSNYTMRSLTLVAILIFLTVTTGLSAQDADTTKVVIESTAISDTIQTDTTKIIEDAALDIAQNRGLFIVAPDGKMQLRILGSVRYLIVYDNINLESKNNLNTYEIPTGEANVSLPNYYNGLDQSRLGFEVTRQAEDGNVFIRLETDFQGLYGFRIRHAYGQYRKFLFGQTWSLFSQISSLPATVGSGGPTGAISVRTPQIRYTSKKILPKSILSFGLEYFTPEITIPDSISIEAFQLIPDITARIEKRVNWGSLQLSLIMPMISGRTEEGKYVLRPGWGVSFSTVVNSWANGKWYYQAATGQSITRFFKDLNGQGLDLLFDPTNDKAYQPITFGTFLTYEHHWDSNIFSNFSYSLLLLQKESFTPDNTYHQGDNFRINTFWQIIEGARVGIEYIQAFRKDKDGEKGTASRVNVLFYYDF